MKDRADLLLPRCLVEGFQYSPSNISAWSAVYLTDESVSPSADRFRCAVLGYMFCSMVDGNVQGFSSPRCPLIDDYRRDRSKTQQSPMSLPNF